MAKKYKSTKLLKQTIAATQRSGSAFGKFANKLADARKKKIQKLTDTQKRLLQSKKNNKMIKVSKKAKKFALLDEQNQNGEGAIGLSLTHKGINIKDLKEFDDVDLGGSDLENDEEFDKIQDKINFAGFDATDNLLQNPRNVVDPSKQKTKTQIYKQIIEKSKAYKMLRQEQYEQNFNLANQLDLGFDNLMTQLKFRNKDQQLLEKFQRRDFEYDKLMNELKDDQRVVSNKIVEKNQKYTQKIRKKKNEQLNKLMRDSHDDADIRGWIDNAAQDQDDSDNQGLNHSEKSDQYDSEQEEQDQQQGSYDQLDEVDLSSEEQQNQDSKLNQDQEQEEQQEENAEAQDFEQDRSENQDQYQNNDSSQQPEILSDQDGQLSQDQNSYQDEESEQITPPKKNLKKSEQSHKYATSVKKPQKSSSKSNIAQMKQNPQKKRKLNFIQ